MRNICLSFIMSSGSNTSICFNAKKVIKLKPENFASKSIVEGLVQTNESIECTLVHEAKPQVLQFLINSH